MKLRMNAHNELLQLSLGLTNIEAADDDDLRITPDEALKLSEAARVKFESCKSQTVYDESTGRSWFDDYIQLHAFFPWRVAAWIAWAASPKNNRWPKRQEELATQVLGLSSDRAIGNWRRKYPDIDKALSVMQAAPLMDHRRDAFEALAYSAAQKSHRSNPDRKLFFEMTGDYAPRMTLEQLKEFNPENIDEMDEKELRSMSKELIERLKSINPEAPDGPNDPA
jgi:hypothetical protein